MRKALLLTMAFTFMLCGWAVAQEVTVSGTVTDGGDGSPLPGVTVIVKGTTNGTITDIDGKYTLKADQSATLVFSYVGYKSQEVAVGSQTSIDVALSTDAKALEEVVVTALGLEQSRDQIGTASSNIAGDAIEKSAEPNLINSLTGKASGVNVVRSSGDPGAGSYIQIRGQSTITGNLQPLIVIDGVPIYNSSLGGGVDGVVQQSRLNDINPNDIASVEVLKGASAAAIWGTRAANGVIMITTKKGSSQKGKINISYKGTISFDDLYLTHELQDQYGQGNNGVYQFVPSGGRSWGDKIADRPGGADDFITTGGYFEANDGTLYYPIANGDADNPHGGKNSRDTYDYRDQLFQTGSFFENSISLSGGDANGNFYMSFSDLNQEGVIRENSDYRRTTGRLNVEKRFSEILLLKGNFSYSKVKSNRVQMGSNTSGLYLGGLRSPADFDPTHYEGTYYSETGEIFPNRQRAYRNPLGASEGSVYDNPLWMMNNVNDITEVNRYIAGFQGDLELTEWLTVTGRVGIDNYTDRRTENFPSLSSTNRGGLLNLQTIRESQVNADLFARGAFEVSEDVNLIAIAGVNFNNRVFDNTGGVSRSFLITNNAPINVEINSEPVNNNPFNDFSQIRTAAAYATTSLSLKNQVFINLTGRAESASTFGAETQSTFFYPSADVAWQFTSSFPGMQSSFLTFGKLRAAYGEVGVQPNPYNTLTYFEAGEYVESWGGTLTAGAYGGGFVQSGTQGNPELRPERKKELEFGLDLRFLKDRLSLSATYFTNTTEDVILPIALAPSTGFTARVSNAGELRNNGVELDLAGDVVKKGNFSWRTNVNWTRYRNEVVSLSGSESIFLNGFTSTSSRAVVGQPIGVLWGGRWLRDSNGELELDANGFPQQGPTQGIIGDPNPDFKMGIGNTFSFKGFKLYALFDWQQGGDIWAGTEGVLRFFGRASMTGNESVSDTELTAWNGTTIPAGTPFRGNIVDWGAGPVAETEAWFRQGPGSGFTGPDEQFIQDATNFRLREVSLSYLLNSQALKDKLKLQSVEFSFSGRNLFIWTKEFNGNDPETNLTGTSNGRGLDYFNNPATRSYLFSIRINY